LPDVTLLISDDFAGVIYRLFRAPTVASVSSSVSSR
jgi:hypothetical protein